MTRRTMAEAFNEWMRAYTDEPERFEREWETVNRYLVESGGTPTYGATCAALMDRLMSGEPVFEAQAA